MLQESLSRLQIGNMIMSIPLLLPANRNACRCRITPKQSCESIVRHFPLPFSMRTSERREPWAKSSCCLPLPTNLPGIKCVTALFGTRVKEYMNMFDVVAMMTSWEQLLQWLLSDIRFAQRRRGYNGNERQRQRDSFHMSMGLNRKYEGQRPSCYTLP